MTQQWGNQGQPAPGGQPWGQPAWSRPNPAWGPPSGYPQPHPGQPVQYPGQPQPSAYRVPQAQFGQPAYGQPGSFQPPNRGNSPRGPRKNPVRGLLLGLLMVVGIGFFLISLMHYLGSEDEYQSAENQPGPAPTATATATVPSTEPAQVPAPDYDPPAIPEPKTYGDATELLRGNPVYAQSIVVPTDCTVPEIDITTAPVGQLTAHLNDLTACLMRVWQAPVTAAGFKLPRPPVTVYNEPITTGCGTLDEVNAVYCAADQRIYYAKPLYRIFPDDQQKARFVIEMVLAHEFGHTIQARSGILISSAAWEQKVSSDEALVYSRRLEVQADCFSGMFTSAIAQASGLSQAEMANLQKVVYNLGDDVLTGQAGYEGNHGSGKARQRWFTTGQDSTVMGECNTYTVPASRVR